jgi:hypothetical protein
MELGSECFVLSDRDVPLLSRLGQHVNKSTTATTTSTSKGKGKQIEVLNPEAVAKAGQVGNSYYRSTFNRAN